MPRWPVTRRPLLRRPLRLDSIHSCRCGILSHHPSAIGSWNGRSFRSDLPLGHRLHFDCLRHYSDCHLGRHYLRSHCGCGCGCDFGFDWRYRHHFGWTRRRQHCFRRCGQGWSPNFAWNQPWEGTAYRLEVPVPGTPNRRIRLARWQERSVQHGLHDWPSHCGTGCRDSLERDQHGHGDFGVVGGSETDHPVVGVLC